MRRKHKIDIGFAVKAGEQIISDTGFHICMAEGCFDRGTYPAPKNRQELRSHIWFCLNHIRMFNSQWNYYDGLEGEALELEIRRATTWERPSWKFATGQPGEDYFEDLSSDCQDYVMSLDKYKNMKYDDMVDDYNKPIDDENNKWFEQFKKDIEKSNKNNA